MRGCGSQEGTRADLLYQSRMGLAYVDVKSFQGSFRMVGAVWLFRDLIPVLQHFVPISHYDNCDKGLAYGS